MKWHYYRLCIASMLLSGCLMITEILAFTTGPFGPAVFAVLLLVWLRRKGRRGWTFGTASIASASDVAPYMSYEPGILLGKHPRPTLAAGVRNVF